MSSGPQNIDVTTERIVRAAQALQNQRPQKDDLVEEFFNKPIPAELWHYTTMAGLEGILTSGSVWATEAHYTTDESEFVHAREGATRYLNALTPETKSEHLAKASGLEIINEEFENGSLSENQTEVFVASFSSAKDLKSQWTGYANNGTGVSIAFDLRNVRPPNQLGYAVTLAPCIYEQAESERLLERALAHFMETTKKLYENKEDLQWVGRKLKDWKLVDRVYGLEFNEAAFKAADDQQTKEELRIALAMTKFDLLRLASHCKNPFYSEEHEWRLSLPHTKGQPLTNITIQHRGTDHNIPYIAHNLFSERLPITQVMLGPSCESCEAIQEMLQKYGYDTPIVRSTGPVRKLDRVK